MKVLILEDSPQRRDAFKEYLSAHELHIYYSAKEAIAALDEHEFDIIFIDHDLGTPVTGCELAKVIAEKDIQAQIVVHSINPVGARAIVDILPEATWAPFPQLIKGWKKHI